MTHSIVPTLVLVEGAVTGLIAWWFYRRKCAKLALCYRARGKVVDVKRQDREGDEVNLPVVQFESVEGREVTFTSHYGSSTLKVNPGDAIEVLVPRNNPEDAELVSFGAQWGLVLVFAIASISSLIAAPLLYYFLK